jgi:hypothetical protein
VTQKIDKAKLMEEEYPQRTLSAVLEDPNENDVGSFTLKQHALLNRIAMKQTEAHKQKTGLEDDDVVDDGYDNQDELMIENNFEAPKGSYTSLFEDDDKEEEKKTLCTVPTPSNKGSMSTAKSSSGPGGHHFGELAAQFDFMNQKNIHNKFDKTLDALTGNVSVTMRVQDDSVLLEKMLTFFNGLAEKIDMSLHNF